ncbi:MAG: hypothetical protein KKC19_00240 [Nanoarchaeota archaeon]|nr:hypothetical protein [Nanoarchaeota archaeon]
MWGWTWLSRRLSTQLVNFLGGEGACITAGVDYASKKQEIFGFKQRDFFIRRGYRIISPKEFYEIQKVTTEDRERVNDWFERQGK